MSIKKVPVTLALVLCLLLLVSTIAFAASYSFHFVPPFSGSAQRTSSSVANGTTAYVYPGGSSEGTTYVLVLPGTWTSVSSFVTNLGSHTQRNFTYNTGYGGSGQSYAMAGYPYDSDFTEYYISGTWKP